MPSIASGDSFFRGFQASPPSFSFNAAFSNCHLPLSVGFRSRSGNVLNDCLSGVYSFFCLLGAGRWSPVKDGFPVKAAEASLRFRGNFGAGLEGIAEAVYAVRASFTCCEPRLLEKERLDCNGLEAVARGARDRSGCIKERTKTLRVLREQEEQLIAKVVDVG